MAGWGLEPPRRDLRLGWDNQHPQQAGGLCPGQSCDPSSCQWSSLQLRGDADIQCLFLKHSGLYKSAQHWVGQGKAPDWCSHAPQGKPKVPPSPIGMPVQVLEFSSPQKLDARSSPLTPSHSHHTQTPGHFCLYYTQFRKHTSVGDRWPFTEPLKYNHYSYFGVFSSSFFCVPFVFFWHSHDHTVYTIFFSAFST